MKCRISFGLAATLLAGVCVGVGSFSFGGNLLHARAPEGDARPRVVEATGSIRAVEVVEVGAQVAGRITRVGVEAGIPADIGTVVEQGTVLARIDAFRYEAKSAMAKAALRRAEGSLLLARAKLALSERELDRTEKLVASKKADATDVAVARASLVVAKAALIPEEGGIAHAKAALELAERELGHCMIPSPITGVVVARRCNVGQFVDAHINAPSLFLIADLKRVRVSVTINAADAAVIGIGQSATITVDAFPGRTFEGKVTSSRPALEKTAKEGKGIYTVSIDFDKGDSRVLPSMTATVRIRVGEKKQK